MVWFVAERGDGCQRESDAKMARDFNIFCVWSKISIVFKILARLSVLFQSDSDQLRRDKISLFGDTMGTVITRSSGSSFLCDQLNVLSGVKEFQPTFH